MRSSKLWAALAAWVLLAAPALAAAPVIYGPTVANNNAVTTRSLTPNFTVGHTYIADTFTSNNSTNVTSIVNAATTCSETGTTSWSIASAINWNAAASSTKTGVCTPTGNATGETVTTTWTGTSGIKQFSIIEMDTAGTWTINHTGTDGTASPSHTSGSLVSGDTLIIAAYGAAANTDTYTDDATFTNINGLTNVAQTYRVVHNYKVASGSGTITYTGSNGGVSRNWYVWGLEFHPSGGGGSTTNHAGTLLRGAGQ